MPMPWRYLDLLQPGDLILSGRRDFISEITQFATDSRFGHAMVVVHERWITQATDVALTPSEDDEGVFRLTIEQFRAETSKLSDVLALRPRQVDVDRLCEAADYLYEHSPTYPTVGAVVLGFCCATARLVAGLPPALKARIVAYQHRLAADGSTKMHCSEFAFRLYLAAGLAVELASPVLQEVIGHSTARQPEIVGLPDTPRRAEKGWWPRSPGRAARYAVSESLSTLRQRHDPAIVRDHACLVLPADLERSPTFTPVFDVSRHRARWHLNLVV